MKQFETLQRWIQEHFPALVMLMVAGGFALTAAELVLMRHTEDDQLIAVVATGAGAAIALAGIWLRGRAKVFVALAFVLLSLSGIFGMVEHLEEQEHEERQGFRWQEQATIWLDSQGTAHAMDEDEARHEEGEGGEEEGEQGPPPLAPLSVSGLAVLGAVAALAKRD